MPETKEYRKKVYSALKGELKDKFTKTEDEFYSSLDNDSEYSKKVYSALKGELGDKFTKSEDEFYSLVGKKKIQEEPTSDASSTPQEQPTPPSNENGGELNIQAQPKPVEKKTFEEKKESVSQKAEQMRSVLDERKDYLSQTSAWLNKTKEQLDNLGVAPNQLMVNEYNSKLKEYKEAATQYNHFATRYGGLKEWETNKLNEIDEEAKAQKDKAIKTMFKSLPLSQSAALKTLGSLEKAWEKYAVSSSTSFAANLFTPLSDEEIESRIALAPTQEGRDKMRKFLEADKKQATEIRSNLTKMSFDASDRADKIASDYGIVEDIDEVLEGDAMDMLTYGIDAVVEGAVQIPLAYFTGGASSFIMTNGLISQEAVRKVAQRYQDQGMSEEEAFNKAMSSDEVDMATINAGSAVVAALDLAGSASILGKGLTNKAKAKIVSDLIKGQTVKKFLSGGLKSLATEEITEVSQEFIEAGTTEAAIGGEFMEGMKSMSVNDVKNVMARVALGSGAPIIVSQMSQSRPDATTIAKAIGEDETLKAFAFAYLKSQEKNGNISPVKAEEIREEIDKDHNAYLKINKLIPKENLDKAIPIQKDYEAVTEQMKETSGALKPFLKEKQKALQEQLIELTKNKPKPKKDIKVAEPKKEEVTKTEIVEDDETFIPPDNFEEEVDKSLEEDEFEKTGQEPRVFESPTDEKYATVNRNDGKGNITLTKAEYDAEVGQDNQVSDEVEEDELALGDRLESKYNGLSIDLYEDNKTKTLSLGKIVVNEDARGEGIGSDAMAEVIDYADKNGLKVILTPSEDFGGNKVRLKSFYKRFGFIENKGKNRDFSHKEDMYREPKTEELSKEKKTSQDQSGAETNQEQQASVETAPVAEQEETSQESNVKETRKAKYRNFEYDVDLDENGDVLEVRGKEGRVIQPENKNGKPNANYNKIVAEAKGEETMNQSNEQRKKDLRFAINEDPQSARVAALQALANGSKVFKESAQDELGNSDSGWAYSSKGKTVNQLANDIWEDSDQYEQERYNTQDIREALNDIIASNTSIEGVQNELLGNFAETNEQVDPKSDPNLTESEAKLMGLIPDAAPELSNEDKLAYYESQYEQGFNELTEAEQNEITEQFQAERLQDSETSTSERTSEESKKEPVKKQPQSTTTKDKTPEQKFEDEITILKSDSIKKKGLKGRAINKRLKDAVKSGEITEDQAEVFESRVNDVVRAYDGVLDAFDRLEEATSTKGKAFDASLGIPLFVVNSSIKVMRAAYVGGKTLSQAINEAVKYLRDKGYKMGEAERVAYNEVIRTYLRDSNEKVRDIKALVVDFEEQRLALAEDNAKLRAKIEDRVQKIADNYKQRVKDDKDAQKAITQFSKDFKRELGLRNMSTMISNQIEKAIQGTNRLNFAKKFEKVADLIKDVEGKKIQNRVAKKIKNTKSAKGKSTLGQYAKEFAKVKITHVYDRGLLERLENIADDLSSRSPKTKVEDIIKVINEVEGAKKEVDTRPIKDRINELLNRFKADSSNPIDTPLKRVNAEIKRQQLLAELMNSEEDIDQNTIEELENAEPEIEIDEKIDSAKVAALANGNLNKAKKAIKEALESGAISQEKADQLNSFIEERIEGFKEAVKEIEAAEKDKVKANKAAAKRGSRKLSKVDQDEVSLFTGIELVDNAAWLTRYNQALESIAQGNIPYQEMTSLRGYSAFNSKESLELEEAIKEIKNNDGEAELIKKLSTKDAEQRARNILKTQRRTIWDLIYAPMTRSLDGARTLAGDLLGDYVKSAKSPHFLKNWMRGSVTGKKHRIENVKAAMVGHYMREASLLGSGTKADGIDVGQRDIFGIILGNEKALDAAGFTEKQKENFRDGKGLKKYDKQDRKLIEEAYKQLPKTNGVVDPLQITPENVLSERGTRIYKEARKVFDRGTEMQKASNLRRGIEFNEQTYYFPTYRGAKDTDPDKPTKQFDKFSERASSGKEKTTESLMPSQGVYNVDLNDLVIKYSEEVATDFIFSRDQPIQNSLMNGVLKRTGNNTVMSAIKRDYAASLDYEKRPTPSNRILNNLYGARYASTLFDPIRSIYETMAGILSIPFKARSLRGIIDMGKSESWKTLNKLQEDYGATVATFQDKNVETQGLKDKNKRENVFLKAGRYTMSAPEYVTSIAAFMPEFRREFKKQTGENFDNNAYQNNKAYKEQYEAEIKRALSAGQDLVYRIYGSKSKGSSRRNVEFAPKWMTKDGAPLTVRADSGAGKLLSFFGTFAYREQGEFFQSTKFFAKDLAKGNFNSKELLNATGVLTNATVYAYGSAMAYMLEQMLLGDDDDKEKAEKEFDEMLTPEGLVTTVGEQIVFLGTGKYGKASRGSAMLGLSALYYKFKDNEMDAEADLTKEILQDNFFLYKPIDITNPWETSSLLVKEVTPALDIAVRNTARVVESGAEITKDDAQDLVYLDFVYNLTNLYLMVGVGTQLPMSRQTRKLIKKEIKKND